MSETAAPPRRGGHEPMLHHVLAHKILHAHLRNRDQLMDRDLADLNERPIAEAALLIRAMATAAHADGALDPQEHEILIRALASTEFDPDERRRLEQEVLEPPCLEVLARQVEPSSRAAGRFYAVSLRVLDRNAKVNVEYLNYLAHRLAVPRDIVVRLNRRFGLPA